MLPQDLVDILEADSTVDEEDNCDFQADYDSDESSFEYWFLASKFSIPVFIFISEYHITRYIEIWETLIFGLKI